MPINIYGGGANTNLHGLQFEQDTELKNALEQNGYNVNDYDNSVVDSNGNLVGYNLPKAKIYSFFDHLSHLGWKNYISKQLLPDDAFFNVMNNTIYIIEKKWQSVAGSVDEKLQTCDFKREEYEKMFLCQGINVEYYYVLNSYFEKEQYSDVKDYILRHGCKYFFYVLPLYEIGL